MGRNESDRIREIVDVYNDVIKYPNLISVLHTLKISEKTLQRKLKIARESGLKVNTRSGNIKKDIERTIGKEEPKKTIIEELKESREIASLKQQIKYLKEQLEIANSEAVSSEKLVQLIRQSKNYDLNGDAEWLTYNKGKGTHPSTPMLFLSDIHFDEVVVPSQIEYMNEYNHDICVQRLKNTFNRALEILKIKMRDFKYNGIVLALGGDIVSGNIHEELAETNDATILETIISAVRIIGDGIGELADKFGKVYVPCVVGNHGRLHKKPRFKYRVQQNYEWIIYQLLAQRFITDKRITFEIPDSTDITFKVQNTSFLLTHGDQFKGGNGISGIFTPLMLGMSKKQKRQSAIHKPFDIMMCGHFHQYIHTNSLIINGSIKGMDEFSYGMNFSYEDPQQAMWLVHPEHGVTIRAPIKCK